MLFHAGALRRVAEAGLLPQVDRFCSVSGGSLTAGILALGWTKLDFDGDSVPRNFETVERTVFELAGRWVDIPSIVEAVFPGRSVAMAVSRRYRRLVFGSSKLSDLPDEPPRFVFNATNLQSGALFRASRSYAADYRVGMYHDPELSLANVVAASTAFPPFLSPMVLNLPEGAMTSPLGDPEPPLASAAYRRRVLLTDGGVYDNLGLEPARSFATVLVSDGGGMFGAVARPHRDWLRQMIRTWVVTDNQVRSLRRRQLIEEFERDERRGTYWGIGTDISNYPATDQLPCSHDVTCKLAAIGTGLRPLPVPIRYRLINWGYAVADAALRSYVTPDLAPAPSFPHPQYGVG